MGWFNKIPVVSQIKSAVQAISGDTKGARKTQEEFTKQAPVVSQVRSAVEAISGNPEAAKKTQKEFLHETLQNTPVISQVISAGHAIAGDSAEAKRIQQKFVDDNVRGMQELLSGSWLRQHHTLATSGRLTNRADWMRTFHGKRLSDMLLPGTHDTATYRFADAALVTNWAQTQQFGIYDQLKGGIRYIDIRVNNEKHDGKIFCSHTFFTIPFDEVIADLSRFIRENPSEVVVCAVQDDGGAAQLSGAKAAAKTALGKYFSDSVRGHETLGELVAQNKRVLYTEGHKCGNLRIENSWDETQDANPVTAVNKCIAFAAKRSRAPGKLVLIALEATMFTGGTPGAITSIAKEINSLGQGLEVLAQYSNYATLHTFLTNPRALVGSNVINMDFANDEIIGKVVSLNHSGSKKIALQGSNGQYVCAEGGGGQGIVVNRSARGPWETFTLHDLGGGKIALQASNGQYVCAEGGGGKAVVANRSAVGPWETFTCHDLGNGKIALQASNGQFVCAEGGGGQAAIANRTALGAWETFTLSEVS